LLLIFQLASVIYGDPNTYGSICAFIIGVILRLGGGEPFFKLKPFIYYPGGNNFPYKTFSMLVSFVTLWVISYSVKYVFTRGWVSPRYDILQCNLAYGGRSLTLKNTPKNNKEIDTLDTDLGVENKIFEAEQSQQQTKLWYFDFQQSCYWSQQPELLDQTWASEGGQLVHGPLDFQILYCRVKFLAKKGGFLSFEWLKLNFTTLAPLGKNFFGYPWKIHYCPTPLKTSFRSTCGQTNVSGNCAIKWRTNTIRPTVANIRKNVPHSHFHFLCSEVIWTSVFEFL